MGRSGFDRGLLWPEVGGKGEDVMGVDQSFTITGSLDGLFAALEFEEGGQWARWSFELAPDRSTCVMTRTVFKGEGGEAVGEQSWVRDLEGVKDDASLPDLVMWISRGLWGIPLRFGPKEESPGIIPGETVSL